MGSTGVQNWGWRRKEVHTRWFPRDAIVFRTPLLLCEAAGHVAGYNATRLFDAHGKRRFVFPTLPTSPASVSPPQ